MVLACVCRCVWNKDGVQEEEKKVSFGVQEKGWRSSCCKQKKTRTRKVYNGKKRKWTKPSSQIEYKAKTVREMFPDIKDEKLDTPNYKSCVKFIGRCEELLILEKFYIEGNDVANKYCVAGSGAPQKSPSVRKKLFEFFIDIMSSLKARLPKKIFPTKAESLYRDYCEWKCKEGVEPEKLSFCNQ